VTLAGTPGTNGAHTIQIFSPLQTTIFTNTITEHLRPQNFTKGGEGTLEFSGAANYTRRDHPSTPTAAPLLLKDSGTLLDPAP